MPERMVFDEYRGFTGEAVFLDDVWHVRVTNTKNLLTDECEDAADAEDTFHDIVDEYLEMGFCNDVGEQLSF